MSEPPPEPIESERVVVLDVGNGAVYRSTQVTVTDDGETLTMVPVEPFNVEAAAPPPA